MASSTGPGTGVRRALLSVYDTTGLAELARGLREAGFEIVATSGTRAFLEKSGVRCRAAEDFTGIGSWFQGRIKTLHPGLLGGILAPRTPEGIAELERRGLVPFDLVVVNLYPFESHLREHPEADDREEFIDVGGVTLLRAAAKNHTFVGVVSDPREYPGVVEELKARHGTLSEATRRRLAVEAFEATARYDRIISGGLSRPGAPGTGFGPEVHLGRDPLKLRYGENPHQQAAVYRPDPPVGAIGEPASIELVKGDSLSYTNFLDLDTGLGIVAEFAEPAAAVTKHANPCGVASGPTLAEAIAGAVATDPVARYGCAIAVNRPFDVADADPLKGIFVDILVGPRFGTGALERLAKRPKLKVVRADPADLGGPRADVRSALGRLLVQEVDRRALDPAEPRLVTKATATPEELASLRFAWKVVRHAKSNGIVLAQGSTTVGIGSGQPARVRSVELAVEVAGERARGSVLASDAFFPFPDGIEVAGAAGVRAILQPGGSLRDPEVIAAADRLGIAMYFTGWRVFRH